MKITKLLVAAALALLALPAHADRLLQTTGKVVVDNQAGTSYTGTNVFPANCTAGSKAIAHFHHYGNGVANQRISAVTLCGTSASKVSQKGDTGNFNWTETWVADNVAGGTRNVAVTLGGSNHYFTYSAQEWRGVYATDQTGTGGPTASSTAPSVTAGSATAQAEEIAYAGFTDYVGTSWTSSAPPSGYTEAHEETLGTSHQSGSAAYGRLTSISTPTATFTTGAAMSWISNLTTFRAFGHGHSFNVDFINDGGSSATTPATTFSTASSGSTFLVAAAMQDVTDLVSNSITDNKSCTYTWQNIDGGTTHTYTDWPTSGTALYASTSCTGGAGHTWTLAKPAANDEVTIAAVELPGTVIQDAAWNEDLTGPTNVSDSVTFTAAGWAACFWWGDDANGEANPAIDEASGWRKVEWSSSTASNHIQFLIGVREVTGAGSVSCTVTPSTSQGAQMYVVAIQAGGGGGATPLPIIYQQH